MGKVFLGVAREKMDMLKTVPLGCFTFIMFKDSLVVTRSVEEIYRMGG